MRAAVAIWLRKSSAFYAMPGLIVIALLILFSRSGWSWEMKLATDWASVTVIVLGPIGAGLVAFDYWRQWGKSVRELAVTTVRPRLGTVALAVATWLWCVAAWLIGVIVALVAAAMRGAPFGLSHWALINAPAVLAAHVALGAVIGVAMRSVAAGPIAALAAYATPIVATSVGLGTNVLVVGGSTIPFLGLERTAEVAVAELALTVAFTALLATVLSRMIVPGRRWHIVWTVACSLLLVLATTHLMSVNRHVDLLVSVVSEQRCGSDDGHTVTVCGPYEGAAIYRLAAKEIAETIVEVERHGVDVVVRAYDATPLDYDSVGREGIGLYEANTDAFTGDGLTPWNVAGAIARPRLCVELFDDEPPSRLLDAQYSLTNWIIDVADEGRPPTPEDVESARATYDALTRCDIGALPAWAYEKEREGM